MTLNELDSYNNNNRFLYRAFSEIMSQCALQPVEDFFRLLINAQWQQLKIMRDN
jgi:hypothetical protein